MKIVVAGFAGAAISVLVVEDIETPVDENVEPTLVWFNDFIPTIGKILNEENVDEILFLGHRDFIVGLANMVNENFSDKELVLTIVGEEEEVSEDND